MQQRFCYLLHCVCNWSGSAYHVAWHLEVLVRHNHGRKERQNGLVHVKVTAGSQLAVQLEKGQHCATIDYGMCLSLASAAGVFASQIIGSDQ